MIRAYLDTNILVDLVLSREDFLDDAQRIFAFGYAGDVQLMVSALSFVNTIYLGKKYKYPQEEVYEKLHMIADFEGKCESILTMMAADCSKAFERLPIIYDAEILRNILYSGIWTRFEAVKAKRQEKEAEETKTE